MENCSENVGKFDGFWGQEVWREARRMCLFFFDLFLAAGKGPKKGKWKNGQIRNFHFFFRNFENFEIPEFDVSDTRFGFPTFFCVDCTDFRRKILILDDFGAKRKKEGLPAAKKLQCQPPSGFRRTASPSRSALVNEFRRILREGLSSAPPKVPQVENSS